MSTETLPASTRDALNGIGGSFDISEAQLQKITSQLVDDMRLGLVEPKRPVAMIPTFVTHIPDGTETGSFLVVDFSSLVFRVSYVTLDGNRGFTQKHKVFTMPQQLRYGKATELFDFLAFAVDDFLNENDLKNNNETLKLCLTFGFAVEKTSINQGKILAWSKGFNVQDSIGKDVSQLLQAALDRKQLKVTCAGVLNDTVALLLSQRYLASGCVLGAIFGTGTNGAYFEDVPNIQKLRNDLPDESTRQMIVNTEWGAFDPARSVLPRTPFDNKLDRESPFPGSHSYEKLTSAMYLGEIVRNLITSLIDSSPPLLFNGRSTPVLNTPYGLDAEQVAMIDSAASPEDIKQIMCKYFGFDEDAVNDHDAQIVRWVCERVGKRAALLAGCGVSAALILNGYAKLNGGVLSRDNKVVVAADGHLVRFYPKFEARLRETLTRIIGADVERRLEVRVVNDEMAVGAALGILSKT